MTTTIIITLCVLVLIAYVFDLSSSRTRIPAVILLLLLGWLLKQLTGYTGFETPDLSPALPVLGTVGLILIVLEGALELELNRSKLRLVMQSFFIALLPIFLLAFGLAYFFSLFGQHSFRVNLINAIPLCVISSSIAIPSVRGLAKQNREFVIYDCFSISLHSIIILALPLSGTSRLNCSLLSFFHLGLPSVWLS
jgi:cell volume regulation protein A